MNGTRQLTITLPDNIADAVERMVAMGHYDSASEAVAEHLRPLVEHDAAIENWLRTEVVLSIEEFQADPSRGIPSNQIMDRIRARQAGDRKP